MDSGFAPISRATARVLILGSLPGKRSIEQGEYYAQPQNAFWRIMGELFGARPELPYPDRVKRLVAGNVALWDVCARARRKGSLDSAIEAATVVPNDFRKFFRAHPKIELVCLNGVKASTLYLRHVVPQLSERARQIRRVVLPSTSPAYASLQFEQKLSQWSILGRHARAARPSAAVTTGSRDGAGRRAIR